MIIIHDDKKHTKNPEKLSTVYCGYLVNYAWFWHWPNYESLDLIGREPESVHLICILW